MTDYSKELELEADRHGLIKAYVQAIIQVESGGVTLRSRYEPGFNYFAQPDYWAGRLGQSIDTEINGQKVSWGLMQVMGGTAREHGFSGYFPELCTPIVGIHFGCVVLSKKLHDYKNYLDAIAAYNAGSVRRDGVRYVNQEYVDKVLRAYAQIKH